jgi:hypothetical protein
MVYRTSATEYCRIYAVHRTIFEDLIKEYEDLASMYRLRAMRRLKYFKRILKQESQKYMMILRKQDTTEINRQLNEVIEESQDIEDLLLEELYSDDEVHTSYKIG